MPRPTARQAVFFPAILGTVLAAGMWLAAATPAQAAFFDFFKSLTDTTQNIQNFSNGVVESKSGAVNLQGLVHDTGAAWQSDMFNNLTGGPKDLQVREKASKSGSLYSPESQQILAQEYGDGGVLGSLGRGIAMLYEPPATTGTFVADLLDSAHIVPKAEAQGLGFAALDPILSTWKIFRNLAYLVFVIIFLVIGFMVMFRQKMGQTAVTLQQAIPNIIVSLLFVTFSYAIAGFLIDLMYLVMYLIIGMFPSLQGQNLMDDNFFTLGIRLVVGDSSNVGALTSVYTQVNTFVTQATQGVTTDSSLQGFLAGITMSLIMAVAIVFGVFKLFFELLKTYVTIVLIIAFSPLILMFGAIPGQNPFKQWVTDLVGNLAAFPVTLLIIVVFRMFTSGDLDSGGFMPPFLIGRGVGGAITTLVGIGVVLIMADLVIEAKKAIGVKDGIFTVLGNKMIDNFKKGIKPATNIATVGGTIAGAGLGAGVGSLVGAVGGYRGDGTLQEKLARAGRGAKEGVKLGAMYGAATPAALRVLPNFTKGLISTAGRQVQDIIVTETITKGPKKLKEGKQAKGQATTDTMVDRARNARTQQVQNGRWNTHRRSGGNDDDGTFG